MALYSLFKLTVLCALFQATAATDPIIPCSGHRTPETSPFGMYVNDGNVPTKYGLDVTTVNIHYGVKTTTENFNDDVTYDILIKGCMFQKDPNDGMFKCLKYSPRFPIQLPPFTHGHFMDFESKSKFTPVYEPGQHLSWLDQEVNKALDITWCPTEGWFVVVVEGPDGFHPYKLHNAGSVYAPVAP